MRDLPECIYQILINIISNKVCVDKLNLKFNGVLLNYETNNLTIETVEHLIRHNIYIDNKDIISNKKRVIEFNKEHFNDIINELDIDLLYLDDFIYKDKYYQYNYEIHKEIFRVVEYFFERYLKIEIEEDQHFVISEISGLLDKKEKIKLLNKKIKKLYKPTEDTSEFLFFMNKVKEDYNENWEDKIMEWLPFDEQFVQFYLTCTKHEELNTTLFYSKVFKKWVKFYRMRNLITLCTNMICEIENPNLSSKKERLIFKDNGLKWFNHIVLNYPKKKNPAFFSYLFFFLQERNKLYILGTDNIDYRNYILNRFELTTYKRIIKSTAYNQETKKRAEAQFDEILKSYSEMNE